MKNPPAISRGRVLNAEKALGGACVQHSTEIRLKLQHETLDVHALTLKHGDPSCCFRHFAAFEKPKGRDA